MSNIEPLIQILQAAKLKDDQIYSIVGTYTQLVTKAALKYIEPTPEQLDKISNAEDPLAVLSEMYKNNPKASNKLAEEVTEITRAIMDGLFMNLAPDKIEKVKAVVTKLFHK